LEILKKAGCSVEGMRVKIPYRAVENALKTVPESFKVYDRLGNEAMDLGGMNSYYGAGPTCPNFFDPRTGERRQAIKQDAADAALVGDALPHIDYIMSLCMVGDTVKGSADIEEVDAMLRNTTKPIASWAFSAHNLEVIIDMCATVAGSHQALQDKPFLIMYSEPTTPLTHGKDALEKVIVMAKNRVPCIYTPGMILGATAPTTMAGAMSIGIAECLTGLIIHQSISPGAPYIAGCAGSPLDMRTMQPPYGAPENILLHGASSEIWRKLGIPSFGLAGAPDAKVVDAQAGFETAMQVFLSGACGGNLIHDVGFMDFGLTGSLQQLVFGNEVISHARRLFEGIDTDDEHLAYDAICAEGPGGNFFKSKNTRKYCRKEIWISDLTERRPYSQWLADGAKTMAEVAQDRLLHILDTHHPEPLPEGILKQLDEIVLCEEERLAK
ncbi:MAG: trimethylamine methyltransferase family protein, partial [Eubacterium sp.]